MLLRFDPTESGAPVRRTKGIAPEGATPVVRRRRFAAVSTRLGYTHGGTEGPNRPQLRGYYEE